MLPCAFPHPNILGGDLQHGRERQAWIGPVPHQRPRPSRLAGRAISVKEPLNPNYISISLWGFFSIQRSAAFFVPTDPEPRRPRRVTRVARSCKRSKLAPEAGRNGDRPRAKAVLTKDILFGMNILTLAGFAVMGLTLTLNRMGQAGKALSIGLMAAGTVLVFLGLYAGGWSG